MIEETLTAKLKAAVGSIKVYPVVAPDNAVAPYVIYQRVSTPRWTSLDGPSRVAQPTFQVDVYHSTYLQARTVAGQIRASLDGLREGDVLGCTLENERDLSDLTAEPSLHRANMMFRITHRE